MQVPTVSQILSSVFAAESGLTDGRLADDLSVHKNAVRNWRHQRTLPSDQSMLLLCSRAKIEPVLGLLFLNIWRSEGRVRATYMGALQRLAAENKSGVPKLARGAVQVSQA